MAWNPSRLKNANLAGVLVVLGVILVTGLSVNNPSNLVRSETSGSGDPGLIMYGLETSDQDRNDFGGVDQNGALNGIDYGDMPMSDDGIPMPNIYPSIPPPIDEPYPFPQVSKPPFCPRSGIAECVPLCPDNQSDYLACDPCRNRLEVYCKLQQAP